MRIRCGETLPRIALRSIRATLASFHRDVERGIFPLDWAGDVASHGEFGEAL
jgi:hypothetical protein